MSIKQEIRRRILIQLSDIPWMVTAGTIGLVIEVAGVRAGFWGFTTGVALMGKIGVLYAGALGYTSFRADRAPAGVLIGGLAGALFVLLDGYVYDLQVWYGILAANFVGTVLFSAGLSGAVAYLVSRIVNPWLLRGAFRWLASNHPKYSHLSR